MKRINYKTTRRIAVVRYAIVGMMALVFSFSSLGAHAMQREDGDGSPKKENSLTLMTEPKKTSKTATKEEAELTRKLFSLGNLIEVNSPRTRGLEIDSTGAFIMSKDVIISNELRAKTETPQTPVALEEDALGSSPEPLAGELTEGSGSEEENSEKGTADEDEVVYEAPSVNLSKILEECKINYVPERNRQIHTGFFVKVPKEMFSSKWSLTLTPKLLLNDSVVALKEIILKGTDFKAQQNESYKNYETYLASIVRKEDYDKKFVDHDGIKKDMKALQDIYYNKYHEDWAAQMAFEKWRAETIDKKTKEVARKVGQRKELYYRALRESQAEKMAKFSNGKDTTGIYSRHMANFEKKAKDLPEKFVKPEITEDEVPKEYKEIFAIGRKLDDLSNGHMTEKDSIEIAKHRYLFDKIAENEHKDTTREDAEKLIIPFPYNREAYLDSIMNGEQNFYYFYPNVTRMLEQETTYSLVVDSKVDVFPNNTFNLPNADTLKYALTSLVDLVDPNLAIKETKIYRNYYNRVTIFPKFESNKTEFKINLSDNKAQIEQLISEYKTYVEEQKLIVDSAMIRVSSSLDGNFYTNHTLAEKRGESMKKFISEHVFPLLDVENTFRVNPVGEDWRELVRLINSRDDMPNKDAILEMIYATTDPDFTEQEIKKKYRTDYRIMHDSIYPNLRKVEVLIFITRPGMDEAEGFQYTEQPGYDKGLKLMRERKYWDALQILSQYPDYNTAVCLASMGHNEKAYEVLGYLKKPSADVDYLKAIVAYRMGWESEAIDFLMSACELDPAKAYRTPCDPEMVALIDKYNL